MKLYAAPLNFRPLAAEFEVPTDFSAELRQAAAEATDRYADQRRDAREIPFVTIDPEGSRDLDQALCIEKGRAGAGYRVYYAIADVAALVEPASPIEKESFRRGQTIYLPDEPARLHPPEISEDAGSLLPEVDRPAVLWTFELDEAGEVLDYYVERAVIRSRAQLDYASVHQDLLAGTVHSSIALLPRVGKLRQASSLRREAISLRLPSQRVVENSEGEFELVIEPRYEVMDYNSEISLLAGMCAGQLMQKYNKGFLRTLPAANKEAEENFWAEMTALEFTPQDYASVSEFLLSIDADTPKGMAAMREAQALVRGADYARLGTDEAEVHAGIGGYYAHVTAPLRRLVDRFSTEVCLALCANPDNPEIPRWVSEQAEAVIDSMRRTSRRASQVDRACRDLTEAHILQPWVGHNFAATILSTHADGSQARALLSEPPVIADVQGGPATGTETLISLITAEPTRREVRFAWPAD